MERMKIMLEDFAKMPERAHEFDAGLDLFAPFDVTIHGRCSASIDTGVHVAIPEGCAGFLKSKSGLNVKEDLTGEGVIDCGYTGSIRVKLYNHGEETRKIQAGQKISQLVILRVLLPELELVEELEDTERGNGGFGSTGKF